MGTRLLMRQGDHGCNRPLYHLTKGVQIHWQSMRDGGMGAGRGRHSADGNRRPQQQWQQPVAPLAGFDDKLLRSILCRELNSELRGRLNINVKKWCVFLLALIRKKVATAAAPLQLEALHMLLQAAARSSACLLSVAAAGRRQSVHGAPGGTARRLAARSSSGAGAGAGSSRPPQLHRRRRHGGAPNRAAGPAAAGMEPSLRAKSSTASWQWGLAGDNRAAH